MGPLKSTHDNLFKSIKCRSKTLPSRVLLAPINTGFTSNGLPTNRLVRFHSERSGTAIGISMVGNVAIERTSRTNDRTAVLNSERDLARFAVLARAIARQGSLAGIQLASAPSALSPRRQWSVNDRPAEATRLKEIVAAFTDKELSDHLANFIRSARFAVKAGYDVVQIHAAHGYLLSLLLHPATNNRRGRFALYEKWFDEFVAEFSLVLGETLSSIRLSVITGLMPLDEEIRHATRISSIAVANGIDIVDLSAGFYTVDRKLIYPGAEWTGPVYAPWLETLARDLDCLVSIVGRITDFRTLTETLPGNVLVSIGRAFIADPDFARKTRDGNFDDINKCVLKNQCHYFSRGLQTLECGVNPNL